MSRMIRISIVSVLTAALFAPATSIAEGKTKSYEKVVARAAAECPDADLDPDASNLGRIRTAILCLHNQIRAQRGLPTLRTNKRLRKAAVGHSRDMVSNDYFEHTTPKGVTMVDRILRARYVRNDQGWALGENLAWGTGTYATPRGAVDAWMNSAGPSREHPRAARTARSASASSSACRARTGSAPPTPWTSGYVASLRRHMADVQPFRALHYDLDRVGGLQPVVAPPYDVIDAAQRAELLARSPYNVVEIDLPQTGGDPYAHAAEVFDAVEARRRARPRRRARAVGARAGLHGPGRAARGPATASSRA